MKPTTRVVITGAPGTGKSTLLKQLENKGYPVHSEMARELIRENQSCESEILPWRDHQRFGIDLFTRQVEQYREALESRVNFFDRGILDNLAYLRRDGLKNPELEARALDYPYHRQVFLTPPWREIYGNDEVRWEDFDTMLDIHRALQGIYQDFGYRIIEVPKGNPEERGAFVLEQLRQG